MAHTTYRNGTEEAKRLRRLAGRWIRDLRDSKGLTQAAMARLLDHDYPTFISAVENGINRVPPEKFKDWAQVLGVERRAFAVKLLQYYDPFTHFELFGDHENSEGPYIPDEEE